MIEPGAGSVRHPHGGAEWDIPVALLEIQRRFDEADAALKHLARSARTRLRAVHCHTPPVGTSMVDGSGAPVLVHGDGSENEVSAH
jgi:hypothetical protein